MTYTDETLNAILPGISRRAMLKAIRDGALVGRKAGRRWYFLEEDVRAYIHGAATSDAKAAARKVDRVNKVTSRTSFAAIAEQEDHFRGLAE